MDIYGREPMGISYAAGLGYDRDVSYHSKCCQIITETGILEMPSRICKARGEKLCNWLIAVTLRLRAVRPDFDLERPSKCPYSASIYVFKPG